MRLLLKVIFRSLGFLMLAASTVASAAPAKAAGTAATVGHTVEQKALCQALDEQLVSFESLLARDENAAHVAEGKVILGALQRRRDAFNRAAFDQAKYDELRFDLNVAYQRLNLWLAAPIAPKAASETKPAPAGTTAANPKTQ